MPRATLSNRIATRFSLRTNGCNRWVLLTRRRAFKFPAPTGWRNFLYGLLNNLNEAESSRKEGACPVLWRLPGGLLNVMPRADELTDQEFSALNVSLFCDRNGLVVEYKRDSFGMLDGKIVAVDYGWP